MSDDLTERVANVVIDALTRIDTANQLRMRRLRRRMSYLWAAIVVLLFTSVASCVACAYILLYLPYSLTPARHVQTSATYTGEEAIRAQAASVERATRAMESVVQNLAAQIAAQRTEQTRIIQAEVARQIKEGGADREVFVITAPEGARVNVRK